MLEILDDQVNLAELLEYIPIPAGLISLESGGYIAVNSSIGQLAKYGQDMGELLLSLFLDRQKIQQLQQGKIIRDYELEISNSNRPACTFLLSAKLISRGGDRFILCLFQDVTDYKKQKLYKTPIHQNIEANPQEGKSSNQGIYDSLASTMSERSQIHATNDINTQKQAELDLVQSESGNRAILRAIPDLIMRLQRDGTCLECLPPAPPHRFLTVRNHIREILPPPLLQKLLQAIATALDEQTLQVYEQEIHKFGQLCDEEVYVVAVGAEEVLVLVRDISDRKIAAQTKLELAQEKEITHLQRRFFAMLSHEFRTPLSTILGSVELLQHSHAEWLDDKAKRNLNRIAVSVQDALELLENMLTLSRADAGSLQVKPQYINLRRFTEELVDSITTERRIILNFKTSAEDYMGYTDPFLLRRLLLNLLNNAIKYSAGDTEIRVFLLINLEQDQAIWQVIDRGIGIRSAELEQIFLPWKRGSNADMARGTGLGLSVVQSCVRASGGVITVQSKENLGTTFTVIIPIKSSDED